MRTRTFECSKHPLLTHEEVVDLAKRIEQGDDAEDAKRKLIEGNLRLVGSLAEEYVGIPSCLTLSDLRQEGIFGLVRAIKGFDWRRGRRFSTYATPWIRRSIILALKNQGKTIRIPGYMVSMILKYQKAENRLFGRLGRDPLVKEIAMEMGLSIKKVEDIKNSILKTLSISVPINKGSEFSFLDFVQPEEQLSFSEINEGQSLKEIIQDSVLTSQEKRILFLLFGLEDGVEQNLKEVGREFNLTGERIRQIKNNALEKLRKNKKIIALE